MPPTKTPPTEPGLYRWHDGRGKVKNLCLYHDSTAMLYVIDPSHPRVALKPKDFTGGYWERIDLGEPYIAPEPPVVELWEGEYEGRVTHFIKQGVSFYYGCCVRSFDEWRRCGVTNIRKVGNLVLEEA